MHQECQQESAKLKAQSLSEGSKCARLVRRMHMRIEEAPGRAMETHIDYTLANGRGDITLPPSDPDPLPPLPPDPPPTIPKPQPPDPPFPPIEE
jgi:hypothetical protein